VYIVSFYLPIYLKVRISASVSIFKELRTLKLVYHAMLVTVWHRRHMLHATMTYGTANMAHE